VSLGVSGLEDDLFESGMAGFYKPLVDWWCGFVIKVRFAPTNTG
jgi:hypothetical protein